MISCGGRVSGAASGSSGTNGGSTTGVVTESGSGTTLVVSAGESTGSTTTGAASANVAGAGSGSTTPSMSGSTSGASAGSGTTTGSAGASGVTSGSASGSSIGTASGTGTASCPGPTRYIDPMGLCSCAGNAYSLTDTGACTCQSETPMLCTYDAGQAPQCVDETVDPNNCGACGAQCKIAAACNGSTCGQEPTTLTPSAAGCVSMRVVYDSGNIYWSDLGHGTISRIPAGGGPVTTMASGLQIAAVQTQTGPLLWPSGPLATSLLVEAGTAYWIGASSTVQCDAMGNCSGGVGSTIMSAAAGTAPKTLLTMAMAPGPSPVSASDAALSIETPGQNPPINAIALSPDGNTLYFAAGTRFYSIPSAGAAAVTYVGYTNGPELGEATALAADDSYLYYPTNLSGNIEILSIGMMCNAEAAANEQCPARISESQGSLVYDNIIVRGTSLFWGNDGNVRDGDVTLALSGSLSGQDFPSTVFDGSLTGFAIGTQYAYFGEPLRGSGYPPFAGADLAGYIEKGASPPFEGGVTPNAIVIARDQPNAMSFALDGSHVYWTTSRCDISYIADWPQ